MSRIDKWKILLIDDEPGIRHVTRLSLEDVGYRVETAQNGAEGLKRCEEFSPHIVITDIRMPGMDGMAVLVTIKERYPETEVIVMTAFGDMELAIRALRADASDFITKPLHDDALHVALDRAKSRYEARRRLWDYTEHLETDWSETTEELIAAFDFQNNLIESSMDGILGCDIDGLVVTFNRNMERISGYTKAEALNRMVFDDFFGADETTELREALAGEQYGGPDRLAMFETHLAAKNGGRIPVQVSASVIADNGETKGRVCFFRDLREMRRLEREMADQAKILHQDKMISLGRLAASVVHEINNPLAGILNYSRLMQRQLRRIGGDDSRMVKFGEYLELIEKESGRCSQIVSSLLTFSRKSSATFGPLAVNELLNRSILLSRHKLELSKIALEQSIAPDLPTIQGDANQLQQCIINLIFNAIDAMPGGGTLTLSAGFDSGKNEVMISVKDTGTGIAEADLQNIFEPFFTTKDEGYGVGLGLSTVFGIIEHHKGGIDVESSIGRGATFTIRLPV